MITHGQKKMMVEGRLKDEVNGEVYTITRNITEKTARLEIRNSKGFKLDKKPQDWLNEMVNTLTFNPRNFINKSSGDKLKFVADFYELDLQKQNKEIRSLITDRLTTGRNLKKIPVPDPVEEVLPIDLTELKALKKQVDDEDSKAKDLFLENQYSSVNEIKDFNRAQENAKIRKDNLLADEKRIAEEIAALDLKIRNLRDQAYLKSEEAKEIIILDIKPVPEIDPYESLLTDRKAELEKQIADAEIVNESARLYSEYKKSEDDRLKVKEEYRAICKKINELRQEKVAAIAKVQLPVEDLKIRLIKEEENVPVDPEVIITEEEEDTTAGEFGLFYKGTFSENWATSEAIYVACKLAISMEPKLRGIFLDQGENWDKKAQDQFDKFCIEHDIQSVVTFVQDIPEHLDADTIYIEDGCILDHNK